MSSAITSALAQPTAQLEASEPRFENLGEPCRTLSAQELLALEGSGVKQTPAVEPGEAVGVYPAAAAERLGIGTQYDQPVVRRRHSLVQGL